MESRQCRFAKRGGRGALVLSAVVTVAMAIFHLRPTREFRARSLDRGLQSTVWSVGRLFTAYFWAEFLAYTSATSVLERAVASRQELTTALGREERQTRETYNQYARVMLRLADCGTRKDLYKTSVLGSKEPLGIGRRYRPNRPNQCLLPNLIALVAILAGVWGSPALPYLRC